jgi:hypothetical protein
MVMGGRRRRQRRVVRRLQRSVRLLCFASFRFVCSVAGCVRCLFVCPVCLSCLSVCLSVCLSLSSPFLSLSPFLSPARHASPGRCVAQPREQELLLELEERDRQLALAAKLGQSLVYALLHAVILSCPYRQAS